MKKRVQKSFENVSTQFLRKHQNPDHENMIQESMQNFQGFTARMSVSQNSFAGSVIITVKSKMKDSTKIILRLLGCQNAYLWYSVGVTDEIPLLHKRKTLK